MSKLRGFIGLFMIMLGFSSCEKIIDVELNEEDRQIVIEARMDESNNQVTVSIYKTTGYFSVEEAIVFENAQVMLTDPDGTATLIPAIGGGNYELPYNPQVNVMYTLTVTTDEGVFEASSFLKPSVPLLALSTIFEEETASEEAHYLVKYNFTDPANELNRYRVRNYVNGEEQTGIDNLALVSDDNIEGQNTTRTLRRTKFYSGELVTIQLVHIDENAYDYYSALIDITGGLTAGVAAPGNPISNWSNNALGSFIVYSSDTLNITIP